MTHFSGFLFSFPINLILICSCSAIGATNCFLLFSLVGRKIVLKYFPERIQTWNAQVRALKNSKMLLVFVNNSLNILCSYLVIIIKNFGAIQLTNLIIFQVNKHRDSLLNYIIFLRITPFLPNWFINMTSPVIGVPVFPFVFGTFLGL